MANGGEISESAEAAGEAAASAVTTAEAHAENVVEAARESVAAAHETAEQIAQAAMHTAIGERAEKAHERIEACLGEVSFLRASHAELLAQLSDLKTSLASIHGQMQATVAIAAAPQAGLIPEPSSEESLPAASPEVPAELASLPESEAGLPAPVTAAARRKTTWI